jgi:hypothetical protein
MTDQILNRDSRVTIVGPAFQPTSTAGCEYLSPPRATETRRHGGNPFASGVRGLVRPFAGPPTAALRGNEPA